MLDFQPIKLEDQERVDRYLIEAKSQNYDECFATLYTWKDTFHTEIVEAEGCLLVRMQEGESPVYLFPIGGDLKAGMQLLMDEHRENGLPLWLGSITRKNMENLEEAFPGEFEFERRRDMDDYIHLTESLAQFKGKSFHGKRGHVKKFKTLYNHEYRRMMPELVPEVLKMNKIWCRGHSYDDDDAALHEKLAAELLLNNLEELRGEGGVLLVDGVVVAASAGTPIYPGSDTIVVQFEKGLTEYEGVYSAICNFFMEDCSSRYRYANREEDLGIPGLRKSKLSYNPEILLEKYVAKWEPPLKDDLLSL